MAATALEPASNLYEVIATLAVHVLTDRTPARHDSTCISCSNCNNNPVKICPQHLSGFSQPDHGANPRTLGKLRRFHPDNAAKRIFICPDGQLRVRVGERINPVIGPVNEQSGGSSSFRFSLRNASEKIAQLFDDFPRFCLPARLRYEGFHQSHGRWGR